MVRNAFSDLQVVSPLNFCSVVMMFLSTLMFHLLAVSFTVFTLYQRRPSKDKRKYKSFFLFYAPVYLMIALIIELIAIAIGAPHSNGRISAFLFGHGGIFLRHTFRRDRE